MNRDVPTVSEMKNMRRFTTKLNNGAKVSESVPVPKTISECAYMYPDMDPGTLEATVCLDALRKRIVDYQVPKRDDIISGRPGNMTFQEWAKEGPKKRGGTRVVEVAVVDLRVYAAMQPDMPLTPQAVKVIRDAAREQGAKVKGFDVLDFDYLKLDELTS